MERVLLQPERIVLMLGAIRDTLAQADKVVSRWDENNPHSNDESLVDYYVESAFVGMLVLLESAGLSESFRLVKALNARARKSYAEVYEYEGDLFLVWPEKLRHFVNALEHAFGESDVMTVTKDISEILRACEYIITDRKLFSTLPCGEPDVHARVEGILRATFPDVRTKPNIDKPIKSFQPDTGIPSMKTLIEYKFGQNEKDVKRVSDELLADTRGYTSDKWSRIICAVYETSRIEPEKKWQQHLRDCSLNENVSIIVLCGEASTKVRKGRGKV